MSDKVKAGAVNPANRNKFVVAASAAFMLLDINIGKASMVQRLPQAQQSEVLAKLAKAGHPEKGTALVFDLFGPHQADFRECVLTPRNKLRTYVYEQTLPFSTSQGQSRGPRLIAVARVPEFLATAAKLIRAAEESLARFVTDYDKFCDAGRRAADHNVRVSGVKASQYLRYPSAEEFRQAFYISISPPRPLPAFDLEKFGSLPASLAGKIADANNEVLAEQLEAAKHAAMEQAEKQMATVAKQLKDGKRLHASLISNSKQVARMLRDMTEGYDRDPRLLSLADLIDEKIGTVTSTDTWQESPAIRAASLKAASTVAKGISDLRKRAEAAVKPVVKAKGSDKAGGTVKGTSVVSGGMLDDLL